MTNLNTLLNEPAHLFKYKEKKQVALIYTLSISIWKQEDKTKRLINRWVHHLIAQIK